MKITNEFLKKLIKEETKKMDISEVSGVPSAAVASNSDSSLEQRIMNIEFKLKKLEALVASKFPEENSKAVGPKGPVQFKTFE